MINSINLSYKYAIGVIQIKEGVNIPDSDNTYEDSFKDVTTPRYLWTDENRWWCHCSHEVSEHRTMTYRNIREDRGQDEWS